MIKKTILLKTEAENLMAAGNITQARQKIKELLLENPLDESTWQLFIETLTSNREKLIALEGMLKINPNNQMACQALEALRQSSVTTAPQPKLNSAELKEPVTTDEATEGESQPESTQTPDDRNQQQETISFEKKKFKPKGDKLKTVGAFAGLVVIILLLISLTSDRGLSFLWKNSCPCNEADAYLEQLQKRVGEWKTYQKLGLLAASQGDIQKNLAFAQGLYDDEVSATVPPCLLKPHEVFLSLLDGHLKYAAALQKQDYRTAAIYFAFEKDNQLELRDAIYEVGLEYRCQP